MQPVPNFPDLITACFRVRHVMTGTAMGYFMTSSKITDRHYEGWLERRHFRSIAEAPEKLPHYILASQLSECVDIASDMPIISTLVDRRVVLLPVQMVAITRLVIDIHEKHKAIESKIASYEKAASARLRSEELQVVSKAATGIVADIGDRLPVLLTRRLSDFWTSGQELCQMAVDGLLPTSSPSSPAKMKRVRALRRSFTVVAEQVKQVVVYGAQGQVDLALEEIELAMRYAHLYRTVVGDRYAMKDALLRLPENLEVLQQKGEDYMTRVLEYGQKYWVGAAWEGTDDLRLLTKEKCDEGVQAYLAATQTLGSWITSNRTKVSIDSKVLETDRATPESDKAYAESHTKKFLIAQSKQSFFISALVGGVSFWAGQKVIFRPLITAVAA